MDIPFKNPPPFEVRNLVPGGEFSTVDQLRHAAEQAVLRKYREFVIVDVDSHHYENENYREVFKYIDSPVIRRASGLASLPWASKREGWLRSMA